MTKIIQPPKDMSITPAQKGIGLYQPFHAIGYYWGFHRLVKESFNIDCKDDFNLIVIKNSGQKSGGVICMELPISDKTYEIILPKSKQTLQIDKASLSIIATFIMYNQKGDEVYDDMANNYTNNHGKLEFLDKRTDELNSILFESSLYQSQAEKDYVADLYKIAKEYTTIRLKPYWI